jgi:hypothetical protein
MVPLCPVAGWCKVVAAAQRRAAAAGSSADDLQQASGSLTMNVEFVDCLNVLSVSRALVKL